jgi:serine/threonine protein phosphatase PrpC
MQVTMIVYFGLILLYFQDEYELSVKPDDVLITATDGLLDNVPQEMICGIMDGATAGTDCTVQSFTVIKSAASLG